MSTYKFVKLKDMEHNNYDNTDITISVETVAREDLIKEFINFIRACGFSVQDLEEEWN